jgi:hypothetical protein
MQTDALRTLATNFGLNSLSCAKAIREMYRLDPIGFPPAVMEVLGSGPDLPGAQFMVAMLASDPHWLRTVCDPQKYTLDQSFDLVDRAYKLDSQIALKLAEMLALPGSSTDAEARFASRVFAVLKRSRPSVALPALRRLSKSQDALVRSKAVLMIGQIFQNPAFRHHDGAEQDPRVVANGIEALWGLASPAAREAFLRAAVHEHHRIAANGIVGLYLMGDKRSIPLLFQLSKSEESMFRAAAAWAMGHLGDPRFLPSLDRLRADSDPLTSQRALRSLGRVRQKISQMRAAGALRVQIRECEYRAWSHLVRFTVTGETRFINDLSLRQFVAWNGPEVVEEFVLSLDGEPACYEITFNGPPSPTSLVKVEVYAELGVGEDTGPEKTLP